MDKSCLDYCLTENERLDFEQNGFFVLNNALPAQLVADLNAAVDRVDARYRAADSNRVRTSPVPGIIQPMRPPAELPGPHERLNLIDAVGQDEIFLELLDWPRTFPKVWGILGWNIQLYHSQLTCTPPLPAVARVKKRLDWHQDSGRLNIELEGDPKPRVSLKIGFFLTDTRAPGRGNFYVVPGSHLRNALKFPADELADPEKAFPLQVPAGTAVFFDRRIWHSASPNHSDITRKVLFYGYSYRWLRPRDDMTVAHFMERCDPIRQQLLGAGNGGFSYTSPGDADVPLKCWLMEHNATGVSK
jgi:ectoine hydroxylase-related dioxygenase (phytanoyl-CoA dioxygenase family)